MQYSFEKFEQDLRRMKPRLFDVYILPAFIIFYAIRSKSMSTVARRMLFSSGVYMGMRNYAKYKEAVLTLAAMRQEKEPNNVNP